jgi:hypothetical protein
VSQQLGVGRILESCGQPLDAAGVVLNQRDVVTERKRRRIVQWARALERTLGCIEPVQKHVGRDQLALGKKKIGVDRQRALGGLDHILVPARAVRAVATAQAKRIEIARIGLGPKRDGLECPFEIARDVTVVRVFDEESLRVSRSVPQLVGAGHALNRQLPLAGPAVAHTQTGVGQSKLGIELDRTLEQRNPGFASAESRRARGAVCFQRLD